ncbi:MAG TPA: transglycosylase SLT domain-containing protein [Bacteroidota bacterium]|nr:transglycosylase SLT domain-containing protein [Bacteroidota bacterium]
MDHSQPAAPTVRRPIVYVSLEHEGAPATILRFDKPFSIGSDPHSDVAIDTPNVSPHHAQVVREDNCWWLRSVEGSKGIVIDGKAVDAVPLATGVSVRLGSKGPLLSFRIEEPAIGEHERRRGLHLPAHLRDVIRASTRIISIEEHKELVRKFIDRAGKYERKKYQRYVAGLIVLGVIGFSYAYYKHTQYEKLEAKARDVFYQMKDLELAFRNLERTVLATGDTTARADLHQYWLKLASLNRNYDQYVDELGIYKGASDEKKVTILRVARIFGECELDMPKGFVDEVEHYIKEWKRSDRLVSSIQRAHELGFDRLITQSMLDQHLPPQFFYLALQESGFDTAMCGPPTRYGIAKGMWQFIPSTAMHYGLRTGPLVQVARTDPRDERHLAEKSTLAAAEYIRDIYDTEAQASGLLVLASYNWGPNAVRGLIREMPENPRQRNFWSLLQTYHDKIPHQTYDYVYFIFSAAVIGENPQLFGFSFDKLQTTGAM